MAKTHVYSGEIDENTYLTEGTQYVHSGGSAVGTIVSAVPLGYYSEEGWETASGDSQAVQIVENGGVTSSVTISGIQVYNDNYEYYDPGYEDPGPEYFYGQGVQKVQSGGSAYGTTVGGYGSQYVDAGGYASGTTVAGGYLSMTSGATVTNLTVTNGTVIYNLGATANGTAYGSSFSINNGVGTGLRITNSLSVGAGQKVYDAHVLSYGSLSIVGGGSASGVTMDGGSLSMADGATVRDLTVNNGNVT